MPAPTPLLLDALGSERRPAEDVIREARARRAPSERSIDVVDWHRTHRKWLQIVVSPDWHAPGTGLRAEKAECRRQQSLGGPV
jgi:hypothetical protein